MSDMDMGERAGEDFAAGQATTSIVKGRAVVVNAEDRARAIHAYYGRSQFALHEQRRWIELGTRPEPSSDTPEHGVDVYEEILPRIAFEFAWQRTELESESVEPDAQTRTIAMAAGLTGNATFEQTIARVRMLVDYARALQLIEIAAENVGYKRTLGAESYAGLPDFVMQLGKDLRRHGKPELLSEQEYQKVRAEHAALSDKELAIELSFRCDVGKRALCSAIHEAAKRLEAGVPQSRRFSRADLAEKLHEINGSGFSWDGLGEAPNAPGGQASYYQQADELLKWFGLHAADVAKSDDRDRPVHYGGEANPFEAIKVIEHYGWGEDFCLGNALKYLLRAGRKGSELKVADLRKAAWYANRAAEKAEG